MGEGWGVQEWGACDFLMVSISKDLLAEIFSPYRKQASEVSFQFSAQCQVKVTESWRVMKTMTMMIKNVTQRQLQTFSVLSHFGG